MRLLESIRLSKTRQARATSRRDLSPSRLTFPLALNRLGGLTLSIASALGAVSGAAAAEDAAAYPSKTIQIVVPSESTGSSTMLARAIADKLTASWKVPVVVLNRPGGSTSVGTSDVARAAPDGYTILLTSSQFNTTPLVQSVPYDPIKSFIPLVPITREYTVIAANPAVPANNLKELVALAKAKPGAVTYAIANAGSPNHLAAEHFSTMNGIRMKMIPYKGSGSAITDVIAGQVQLTFNNAFNLGPLIKSGALKGLAVSGPNRLPSIPNVPTVAESGIEDFNGQFWFGTFLPAGVPKPIDDKLAAEINRIVAAPDFQQLTSSVGALQFVSNPEKFAEVVKDELAANATIIKSSGIKISK